MTGASRANPTPVFGVIIGFCAVVVVSLALLLTAAAWTWWSFDAELGLATIVIRNIALAAAIFSLFLAFVTFRAARRQRSHPSGVLLPPAAHPELHHLISDIAAAVDAAPPDDIWLTTDTEIAVTHDTAWFGIRERRRHLHIGYPLLVGSSQAEFAALCAAAMAVFTRRNGAASTAATRCATVAAAMLTERSSGIAGIVLDAYASAQVKAAFPLLEQRLKLADQLAAATVGRDTFLRALRREVVMEMAWEMFLDQYLRWGWESGYRPIGCLAGFGRLVDARADALAAAAIEEDDDDDDVMRRQADIESQPPPAITNESVANRQTTASWYEPAPDLVSDFAARRDELETIFVGDPSRPALPWPEFIARAATTSAQQAAARLYQAAGQIANDPEPSLRTVIELLEHDRVDDLILSLTGAQPADDEYEDAVAYTAESLGNACAVATVAAGVAWWRMSWEEPLAVVGADGEAIEWQELAEDALVGDVDALMAALARHGIDPSGARQTSVGASVGQNWLAGISDVKSDGFTYDLLLHTGGILLAPLAGVAPSAALSLGQQRLDLWTDMLPSDVAKIPGATDLARVDIVAARLVPGRPLLATITLLDGRELRLKAGRGSQEWGEGVAGLEAFLGAFAVPAGS